MLPSHPNQPIVKIKCLKHRYPDQTEISACGLEFLAYPSEKIALIGKNGAGKTTLLYHLLGLLKPTQGEVKVFNLDPAQEFSKIGPKIGFVVQNPEEQLIGPTVFEDIAFSLINYGFTHSETEKRTKKIIQDLKIKHLQDKLIHYLSEGEKKKVALAGALALEPKLLLLDETLSEIDQESLKIILKKLNELNQKNKMTIIMATNELPLLADFFEIIYLLENGRIVFKGNFDELTRFRPNYTLCRH